MMKIDTELLDDFNLDLKSRLPYYYQVHNYLLDKINNYQLKAGYKLPSEETLSKLFKVSRVTIRLALNELELNNLILRKRGSGTYISENIITSLDGTDGKTVTLRENANGSQTILRVEDSHNIVGFMVGQVGGIKANEWKPVIRPSKEKFIIAYGTIKKGLWWYHGQVEQSILDTARSMGCEAFILDNKYEAQAAIENTKLVIEKYRKGELDFFINAQLISNVNNKISEMLKEARVPSCGVDIYLNSFPWFHVNDYKGNYLAGEWLGNYAKNNDWTDDEVEFVYLDQQGRGYSETRKQAALDGVRSVIKLKEKNYHVLLVGMGTIEEAKEKMCSWLRSHPYSKKVLVAGTHNYPSLGASAALREAGRENDAVACGLGGGKEELQEIIDPNSSYKASVSTFPEKYGNIVIPYAVDYLEGLPVPIDFVGYIAVITIDNLERFYPEFLLR